MNCKPYPFISRQLGFRNSTKLVPLVQELAQQIHLFLAEYNRYNSDSNSFLNPQNNTVSCDKVDGLEGSDSVRQIHLPGFRMRTKTNGYVVNLNYFGNFII